MPLENRVDPFGRIHARAERGSLMGNRGIIHDPRTRTLLARRWTSKAWIICLCAFRGRRRTPMASGYTELFFLDEATALAAGHRPCFECQRERAKRFAVAFAAGCGCGSVRAGDIDARLHLDRPAAGNAAPEISADAIRRLPDGSMIGSGGAAFLVTAGRLRPWSFAGYGAAVPVEAAAAEGTVLLTPAATVGALKAGYRAGTAVDRAA